DLGRTDEREVLRPEEHHAPLALVGLVVDRLERVLRVQGDAGGELVLGELVTDSKHACSFVTRSKEVSPPHGGTGWPRVFHLAGRRHLECLSSVEKRNRCIAMD